jgi:DNA topoisomerase-1
MAKKTTKKTAKKTTKKSSRKRSSARVPDATDKELVIVESPAKARTINKYLGNDYVVLASVGHVRDLPSKPPKGVKRDEMPVPGVDLQHDFKPTYDVISGKGTTVTALKKAAKQAKHVWLATDLDREGEAIAWHLAEALKVPLDDARRVVFNAITKDEIQRAFDKPRHIDMDKVNAQQARRILDRIVGYQVSPLLWKKVAGGLSAGRVQSVAVRLIVEREREIDAFVPDEYWKITGYFTTDTQRSDDLANRWMKWLAEAPEKKGNRPVNGRSQRDKLAWLAKNQGLLAELIEVGGEKFEAKHVDAALEAAEKAGFVQTDKKVEEDPKGKGPAKHKVTLTGDVSAEAKWQIGSIETKRTRSRPYAPFITSTLQQSAANQLNFTAQTTMRTAQQLYEGIEIGGEGSVGLITYMRTDSTHLSGEALNAARTHIAHEFGEKYLPDKPNFYSSSNKDAQEAHEAIRPTDVRLSPNDPQIKRALDERQWKLYDLIWRRFVACQMTPAEWDTTSFTVTGGMPNQPKLTFRGSGRTLAFDGFYKVAGIPNPADDAILPPLDEGKTVAPLQVDPTQHFTSPPPRYTEASLVKKLESEGIGRPSTYAAIIQVIQNRKYVEKIQNRFFATDLGEVVTDKLIEGFPGLMDVGYTRWMEEELDAVEEQHHDWVEFLHKFYGPFQENLAQAHEDMSHAKAETQPSDHECPECGAKCVYRFGKNGRFLSCGRYPDCKYAAPIDREGNPQEPEQTDIACPLCGKPLIKRTGRFGPFLSCSDYPDCKGIVNLDKKGHVKHPSPPPLLTDIDCPKCEDGKMNLRRGKRGPWLSCAKFPKCRGRVGWTTLDEDQQKQLELALKNHEKDNPQPTIKTLDGRPVGDEYTPQVAGQESENGGSSDLDAA